MKKLIVTVLCIIILTSMVLSISGCNKLYADYKDVKSFALDDNGEFKILTLADLHFKNDNSNEDHNMLARMQELIDSTNPDLIVILGDLLYSSEDNFEALRTLTNIIDSYEVPWAPVYGNHDPENAGSKVSTPRADSLANKQVLNAILLESEHCLFQIGPEDIDGSGNYVVNIVNDNNKIIQTLFFIDSNDYVKREDVDRFDFVTTEHLGLWKNYGFIYPSQIKWYEETVKDISNYVYRGKQVVPSLAFFHIPLPEYNTAWELHETESNEVTYLGGQKGEPVGSPTVNTGMFDKMVELGSTKAVFVGHEHANDFAIDYKGITLAYNGGMKHITYIVSNSVVEKTFGGRLITITEDGYSMEKIYTTPIEG